MPPACASCQIQSRWALIRMHHRVLLAMSRTCWHPCRCWYDKEQPGDPVCSMSAWHGIRSLNAEVLRMCKCSTTLIWTSSEDGCLCSFDEELEATLNAAPVADTVAEAQGWIGDVQLYYHTQEHFEALAKALGIMKEWRDGVPRAAYKGVVS